MKYPHLYVLVGLLGVAIVLEELPSSAAGPSPQTMQYQGRLTDSNGAPLNGTIPKLTFRLYNSAAPLNATTFVWGEAHTNVPVRRGVFTVRLGAGQVTVDGNGVETPATPNPLLPADLEGDRWIQVQVGADPPLSPPVALGAVPHAISAASAMGIFDPSTSTALDLTALDARWVGTVGGTAPDANGNFDLAAGFGTTLTTTTNGVTVSANTAQLDTRYLTSTLGQLDGRYLNVGEAAGDVFGATLNLRDLNVQRDLTGFNGDFSNELTAGTFKANFILPKTGNSIRIGGAGAGFIITDGTTGVVIGGFTDVQGALRAHSLQVSGPKMFVVDHPNDQTKEIVYCSLEGPECAMYSRGSSQLTAGQKTVDLPEHFAALAVQGTITVTVTPTGNCKGLYVESKASDKIVVKELGNASNSTVTFDYMVYAVRRGQENFQPVRVKSN
jgi:hypothetical protein